MIFFDQVMWIVTRDKMVYDFVNNKSDYLAVRHTSIALQLEKYKSYERKI